VSIHRAVFAVGASNSRSAAGPFFFSSAVFLGMIDASSVSAGPRIESDPLGKVVGAEVKVARGVSSEERDDEVVAVEGAASSESVLYSWYIMLQHTFCLRCNR
jgi:hypothetical protein